MALAAGRWGGAAALVLLKEVVGRREPAVATGRKYETYVGTIICKVLGV
jgi:hypothetical protein